MPDDVDPRSKTSFKDEKNEGFIPPHGGYEKLLSFQKARIVYDGTVHFCDRWIDKRSRTRSTIRSEKGSSIPILQSLQM